MAAATRETEALVADARDGDRDALESLIRRCQSMVFATAYAGLGTVEDAQDVAQEAFLVSCESLPLLRSGAKFGTWLRGITKRLCERWHRSEAYRRAIEETLRRPASSAETETPERRVAAQEDSKTIKRAIEQLPENLREALIIHYFWGQSLAEMAKYLGVSKAAATKRVQRARARLRDCLTKKIETDLRNVRPGKDFTSRVLAAVRTGSICTQVGLSARQKGLSGAVQGFAHKAFHWTSTFPGEGVLVMSRKGIIIVTAAALLVAVGGGAGYFAIKHKRTTPGASPFQQSTPAPSTSSLEHPDFPTSEPDATKHARSLSGYSQPSEQGERTFDAVSYMSAAMGLISGWQYADAVAVLDEIIANAPEINDRAQARLLKGICLRRLGKPEAALSEFQAVIAGYPEPSAAWEAARMFAEYHFNGEMVQEGIEWLGELLDADPGNLAAMKAKWNLVELAASTADLNDLPKLLAICEQEESRGGDTVDAQLARLALSWAMRRVDRTEALRLLEGLAQTSSASSVVAEAIMRQATLVSKEDTGRAIALLEEVLSLPAEEPSKKRARLELAALYAKEDVRNAVLTFEQAKLDGWTETELSNCLTGIVTNAIEGSADTGYLQAWLTNIALGEGKLAEDARLLASFMANPQNAEPARPLLQQREVRELLTWGEYQLRVNESGSGKKDYTYTFTFSDGEEFRVGSPRPLGDSGFPPPVNSGELEKLIAQGKGQLLEVRGSDAGMQSYIYRVTLWDGTSVKYVSPVPLEPPQ